MAAMAAVDANLDNLPVEILLQVLDHVSDVPTLGSLIHASPAVYRILDDHKTIHRLIDAICATGYTCGHTWVMFRICALIRSGKLPLSCLAEFQERVVRDALRFNSRIRPSRFGFAPETLDKDVTPSVIKSLLATARQASDVAVDCLDFYLTKFRALQPRHLIAGKTVGGGFDGTWILGHASEKVDVVDAGPPSWEEEQRAIRALWRLQLVHDLKHAATRGLLSGWPVEDMAALEARPAISHPLGPCRIESFYGARDNYKEHIRPDQKFAAGLDFYIEIFDENLVGLPYILPEYEEIYSVVKFVHQAHGFRCANSLVEGHLCLGALRTEKRPRPWPPPPGPGPQSWRSLMGVTLAVKAGPIRGAVAQEPRLTSPLTFIGFDVFEQYGFAFWSEQRMAGYGLLSRRHRTSRYPYRSHWHWSGLLYPFQFAWYSILDQEDAKLVEKKAREYFKSHGYLMLDI
jgi:hypothetical protein